MVASVQKVLVEEPSEAEAIQWLLGLRPRLEAHHGLTITTAACTAAVRLAKRYAAQGGTECIAFDEMYPMRGAGDLALYHPCYHPCVHQWVA